MKKTLLAMLLAGGTMTLFAQTTQTNTTTGEPGNQMYNANQMNHMDTTTPGAHINMRNGVRTNSTSWAPEKQPSQGWNSYGVWSSDANWNANPNNPYGNRPSDNAGMNHQNMNNNAGTWNNQNTMNADGSMSSTGAYSAYGTTIPYLPANVQMRFSQDYPMTANNTYSWHQYGDWFHTNQINNGRSIQYFYDTRGNGYSLALPILLTYVPENIVTSALNKFGNDLYSISMVKTNDGNSTYAVNLLDRGQMSTHYLNESGATVDNVWRTEDYGTMQSTQSNAAMDGHHGDMHDMNKQNANDNDRSWNTEGIEGRVVNPGTVNNAADTQMPNQQMGNEAEMDKRYRNDKKMKDGKMKKDKHKSGNHHYNR